MLTEQERSFLEAIAKAPIPTDVQGLRAAMDTFAPMLNSDPPEIGAFHEAVQLRPGLTADVAVPKGNGPHPVVVYLHGGGWIGGSPKDASQAGDAIRRGGIPDDQCRLSPRARASVSRGSRGLPLCGEVDGRERQALER